MEDPKGELRRQRELVATHLRWLDEQIARTPGAPPPDSFPPPPPSPLVVPAVQPLPVAAASTLGVAPESHPEIALPEIDPGSVRNEVRRGCFIYVAIASLLLIVSVALAIWIARSW